MNEKKSLAEEALLQMKQVEEVIAENAKGILASTMKEEINQLVKESLSEEEDEDEEVEMDDESEDEMEDMDVEDEEEMSDTEMDDMESDDESEMDMDSDVVDLTGASDEEILKVFKAMGEEDGIIIKKDGEDIHLKDSDGDNEYLIKLGESMEDYNRFEGDLDEEMDDEKMDDVINAIFQDGSVSMSDDEEDEESEVVYEIHMDEDDDLDSVDFSTDSEIDMSSDSEEMGEPMMDEDSENFDDQSSETIYEIYMDEDDDFDQSMGYDVDGEGSQDSEIYEMYDEMEEESEDMGGEFNEEDFDPEFLKNLEGGEQSEEWTNESYSHKKAKKTMKPKGRVGSGPKFTYGKTTGGFSEEKKEGPKTMGTGKPKFVYKQGENMGGKNKIVKKVETKEAARTLGMGSKFRHGGLPKPRAHSKANTAIKESLESEVSMLREKNEEYRKALNVFREKLNEVAIFNSNLAYATRLFTEHSTTKKEKINILRRFDGVDTLKESKNLYRSIREELSTGESKSINESVENKINKTVSTGSSTTLIESKTYENPQFMRIKDLMGKIV